MHKLLLASLFAFTGMLPAQVCGTLAISGSGAPGTQLSIDVSGAAASEFAVLLFGETTGSTSVALPAGSTLVLGLDLPFFPLPLGQASANGDVSVQIDVPAALGVQYGLHGQAVLVGFSLMPFGLRACASNVVPFSIG